MVKEFNVAVQAFSELDDGVFYECLECGEPVTNPICPECLFKEFAVWVAKYPRIQRKVVPVLKKFLKVRKNFEEDSQTCVVCKNNSAYLCPYCFTEFVLDVLKESGADEIVIKDYLEFFNFDFGNFDGKLGYYNELEKFNMV